MRVSGATRRTLRVHSAVLIGLLLGIAGLLAWLSTRYTLTADWTMNGRHTLSEVSKALLKTMTGPIEISAYARPEAGPRDLIQGLVDRYRRLKPDLALRFIDPDTVPDELRELGIRSDGELVVRYRGRTEHVQEHTEGALTNALQRLMRSGERWLVFLEGHGEREAFGQANHDLGQWVEQLEKRGLKPQGLNLGANAVIPDNTSVLMIATPQVPLLPGEVELVKGYVERGGNLLWLTDPGSPLGLPPLAEALGLSFGPGTVVDPATALFGIEHPAMVPVTQYPEEPPLAGFRYVTVFPYAQAVTAKAPQGWQAATLITVGEQAWAESGKLEGELRFDEGADRRGPFDIGLRLTRPRKSATEGKETKEEQGAGDEQRIVVLGDGDFLSNSYLGNGGNLDLGLRLVNWLTADEALIEVPARPTVDLTLELSDWQGALIAFGFLLILPAMLAGVGVYVWLRRRRA